MSREFCGPKSPSADFSRFRGQPFSVVHENETHGDILFVPEDVILYRIRSLIILLKHAAQNMHPSWIAKMDDDVYVHLPMYLRYLQEYPRPYTASGYTLWQNWETKYYLPKTFRWTKPEADEYLAGDPTRPEFPSQSRSYRNVCVDRPWDCPDCTRATDCLGPFPFFAGRLFAFDRKLAHKFLPFAEEELSVAELSRSPVVHQHILEDIWAGMVLYKYLSNVNVTIVNDRTGGEFIGAQTASKTYEGVERHILGSIPRGYNESASFVFHHVDLQLARRFVQEHPPVKVSLVSPSAADVSWANTPTRTFLRQTNPGRFD